MTHVGWNEPSMPRAAAFISSCGTMLPLNLFLTRFYQSYCCGKCRRKASSVRCGQCSAVRCFDWSWHGALSADHVFLSDSLTDAADDVACKQYRYCRVDARPRPQGSTCSLPPANLGGRKTLYPRSLPFGPLVWAVSTFASFSQTLQVPQMQMASCCT